MLFFVDSSNLRALFTLEYKLEEEKLFKERMDAMLERFLMYFLIG